MREIIDGGGIGLWLNLIVRVLHAYEADFATIVADTATSPF